MISTKVRFYFVLNDRFLEMGIIVILQMDFEENGHIVKDVLLSKCCILIHILPSLIRSLKLMYQLDIIVKWLNLFRRVVV